MKVEYKINLEAQRPATLILAGCILVSLILSIFFVQEHAKVENYATVEAIVIKIIRRGKTMSKLGDEDYIFFVRYAYNFENKEYVAERQEDILRGKYVGKQVSIWVSPKDPTQIQNIYNINVKSISEKKMVRHKTPTAGNGIGDDGFISISGSGGVKGLNNIQIILYWGVALGGIDWMTRAELAEAIPQRMPKKHYRPNKSEK